MNSKDNVNRPKHYRKGSVECIDAIKSALGEGYEYYLQGNIIKYVWRYRHKHKNSLEDLMKAEWYLKELIVDEYAQQAKKAEEEEDTVHRGC